MSTAKVVTILHLSSAVKQYLVNILVGVDQLANAVLGGDPMQTISYRSAMAAATGKKWGCILCKFLGMIQKDHCKRTEISTDRAVLMWPVNRTELE